MFHYLRPHRRTPSTPSSPNPEQHSFEPPSRPIDHGHPARFHEKPDDKLFEASTPPLLPPIARVSSAGYGNTFENSTFSNKITTHGHDPREQSDGSRVNNGQKDAFEAVFQSRLPYVSPQRPDSIGDAGPGSAKQSTYDNSKLQGNNNQDSNMKLRRPDSRFFGSNPDPEAKSTGRRPTGTRLPSPPLTQPSPNFEQPAPTQSGKTRLKMLNPMALLARRRTSQAIPHLAPESLISSKNANGNFDPRIKGTVVHDFSAPRGPRRNMSQNDINSAELSRTYPRSPIPEPPNTDDSSRPVEIHTPVFTENFEEEQYPLAGPHVRKANDLSDLTAPKPPYAREAQRSTDQNLTIKSSEQLQVRSQDLRDISPSDIGPPVPPKPEEIAPVESKRISIDPGSTPPKAYPSSRKGRSRNVSEVSAKDTVGLPRHMKSTSSRFSFDMIGAAEQERLLEDRHRQKALEKKNSPDGNEGQEAYDEEDDFNYDDMMDDNGLEEMIPGVNIDYDDDRFPGFGEIEDDIPGLNNTTLEEIEESEEVEEDQVFGEPTSSIKEEPEIEQPGLLDGNVSGFTFQSYTVASPPSPYTPGTATTPRDSNGNIIGFAITKTSPFLTTDPPHSVFTPISPDENLAPDYEQALELENIQASTLQGLGIVTEVPKESPEDLEQSSFPQIAGLDDDDLYFDDGIIGHEEMAEGFLGDGGQQDPIPTSFSNIQGLDDDDLYFDDGIIDHEEGASAEVFDESIFDKNDTDQYGRPLKKFSAAAISATIPATTANSLNTINEKLAVVEESPSNSPLSPSASANLTLGRLAPQPSFSEKIATDAISAVRAPQVAQDLTQDTLAAYQSALAAAAMSAAANGKFRRDSTQSLFPTPDPEDAQPGLITDSGHTSSHYDHLSPSYDDDFDYDDALEDDEFIAAANAEALANDPDGFYGTEFGFYSQPAASSAEYANGGYFGPRGNVGVIRSQSGRVASREPNLTPITERSEYSNRNSFMSQALFSPGAPSPGLAQLMLTQDYERAPDMSLETLMKLRNRAWGGSQASAKSTGDGGNAGGNGNGNGNGSPGSVDGGEGSRSPVGGLVTPWGHKRKGSAFSLVSEEDLEEEPESKWPVSDLDNIDTIIGGQGKGKSKAYQKSETEVNTGNKLPAVVSKENENETQRTSGNDEK